MVGLLVDSQGQRFEGHLPTILPLLSECLQVQHEYSDTKDGEVPVSMATDETGVVMGTDNGITMTTEMVKDRDVVANYLSVNGTGDKVINEEKFTHNQDETENETAAADECVLDHFLFRVIQVLCKVFTFCPVLRSSTHRTTINCILGRHTYTSSVGV